MPTAGAEPWNDAKPLTRATAWEWAQALLLSGNLVWTTLCLGGFRPETMIVTSALNAALLVVHLLARSLSPADARYRLHAAGWWMLPFLAYAAINVLCVTPVRWLGWRDWLGWAQMILVFWVALNGLRSTAVRRVVFGALCGVALVSCAMAAYQRFVQPDWLMLGRVQADQFIARSSGSFGIPNSLAALLLLLIPLMTVFALRRGIGLGVRVGWIAVLLIFVGALVLTVSRGAWLSLALVVAAWPIFTRGPWWRRLVLGVCATAAVAGAFVALYFSLPIVRERLDQLKQNSGEVTRPIMWRGAWLIFREHPKWGGGAGSYNVLFEKFRPERYQDEPVWAHNDYVNTLSDYGLCGFVLFFGVAAGLGIRTWASRTPPLGRDALDSETANAALVAGLIGFSLQLFVDFHFKIPALGIAFAIVAAQVVQRTWPASPRRAASGVAARGVGVVAALAVAIAAVAVVQPFYRGEALRYSARQAINRLATRSPSAAEQRAILEQARFDLSRATVLAPANGQAWADLSYATSLWALVETGRTQEFGQSAEKDADRALALSTVVPEFWVRKGVALDMQGRHDAAGAAIVKALLLAPADAGVWFYQAYHLSLNKRDVALALAAVDVCLRLDPGNTEAQSLRQRLASGRRAP